MAHPYIKQAVTLCGYPVLDIFQKRRMAARPHFGVTEFAHLSALNLAAQLVSHGLHAITDAENRNAEFKHQRRCAGCALLPHRRGAAGQDDPAGLEVTDELLRNVIGMEFAINMQFAYAACNQLGVLRAEIENQDFFVVHVRAR